MKHFGQNVTTLFQQATEHATTGFEYFSLADTANYEETIIEGYRGDLDANAGLSALPHDVYSVLIKYAEKWPGVDGDVLAADPARRWRKKIANDGKLMWMTFVTYTTLNNADPAHDNRERQMVVTTYPNKQGTTGVQALLQGMDVDTMVLNSHEAQMIALDKQIAGDGCMAGIELDWEATVYDKDMGMRDKKGQPVMDDNGQQKMGMELWKLRGMKKFPKLDDGSFSPDISEKDGFSYQLPGPDGKPTGDRIPVIEARARNFERRFVPFSKLSGPTQLESDLQQSVEQAQAAKPPATAPAAVRTATPARAAAPAPAAPAQAAPAAAPRGPQRPGPRRVSA